ncbi:MAG: hypothetical protein ACOCZ7_04240, partial [Armatimonadota bacterium]
FLYTALKWQRNMALFAFAIAPVFALHLGDLLERLTSAIGQPASGSRDSALLHWAIVIVLAVSAIMSFPAASRQTDEVFRDDMPVECVEYVKNTGLEGRMYNTYRWGGYLIWHLWPEHMVMLDGRADVMGRELVADWRTAHTLDEGWEQILEEYEIDCALISMKSPLVRALDLHPDWRLACEESTAQLFVRRGSVADRTAGAASVVSRD